MLSINQSKLIRIVSIGSKMVKARIASIFNSYDFNGEVLFFLSPGQVFTVTSEKIKEAYQLSFIRDFYCIQTHDKEVSCNGVLFNNVYESPFVKPNQDEKQ